jgi:hypothetical protein
VDIWPGRPDYLMGICPRENTKVVSLNIPLFIINIYVSCYNCILVLNMRFGGKPNYTCGIINNKEFPNLVSEISSYIIR